MTSMQDLIIYGAGSQCLLISDLLAALGTYRVIGILDDDPLKQGAVLAGSKVIGTGELLDGASPPAHLVLAIGDPAARRRIAGLRKDYTFPPILHPSVIVGGGVKIGPGVIVMPGAILEHGAEIGAFTIINNASIVGRQACIGSFCHVADRVGIGHMTVIGDDSFIGMGAHIMPKMTIGANSFIGIGSAVLQDVHPGDSVFGVPARKMPFSH